jgi:REP element-mobilizing transposase RayT
MESAWWWTFGCLNLAINCRMARAPAIQQSDFPYHVSARCINKEWFSIPMEVVWEIMARELTFLTYAYDFKIHSFVLMTNHFHLLASTPSANLSAAMQNFMGKTSRQLAAAGNRINQTYGGRHFRSVIQGERYFSHAYKYVYANPVKAGLASKVEEYKYSTLNGLLGFEKLIIPVVEDTLLFNSIDDTLRWLNSKPKENDWEFVRKAMRKRSFKLPQDCNSGEKIDLEFGLL